MVKWKNRKSIIAGSSAALLIIIMGSASNVFCLTLDQIIERVEKQYADPGFSARFFQTSTLKAMQITENASGLLMAKRPDRMRWEYEKPEPQVVVTDGTNLWVYRPNDNQVMIGKAPTFFGDGKGAGFLSDIERVRRNFTITLEGMTQNSEYRLKLLPKKKTFDIAVIHLGVSSVTFDVVEVVTANEYGDETRILLTDIQHRKDLDDDLFRFKIPEGADIIKMDQ